MFRKKQKKDMGIVHRTPHTEDLDLKVGVQSEYRVSSSLGKTEWEMVGHLLLHMAKEHGHFVAIPRDNLRLWRENYPDRAVLGPSPDNATPMLERHLLVSETLESGIEVVSPSYITVYSMYFNMPIPGIDNLRDYKKWIGC